MSVPTHNLYEFINHALKNKYWCKTFYPWGSRDLLDVIDLYPTGTQSQENYTFNIYKNQMLAKSLFGERHARFMNFSLYQPVLFCHDQEPLDYELYTFDKISVKLLEKWRSNEYKHTELNLRHTMPYSLQKKWILLHSELNSPMLEKYENSGLFIGAYWWSHAFIARDWYRYAEFDRTLVESDSVKKFLVYCRDCTGSREYRKQFLQQLSSASLIKDTQLGSFHSEVFHGLDYRGEWKSGCFYNKDDIVEYSNQTYQCIESHHASHNWNKTHWKKFFITKVDSNSSATYDSKDFASTDISVVLETLFDTRIHLTEKTLRPIACKHPFLLAAGPGSLKYLRSYGFRTFHPYIDESYDSVYCNSTRLKMIVSEMHRIRSLPEKHYKNLIKKCKEIANYNHNLFFSKKFYDCIISELITNVTNASMDIKDEICWEHLWHQHKMQKKYRPKKFYSTGNHYKHRVLQLTLIRHLKKGGTLEDYVPPDLD